MKTNIAVAKGMDENELDVLLSLDELSFGHGEDHYFSFSNIQYVSRLDRNAVRRACRSLKLKGLAEFKAGSGYRATSLGFDIASLIASFIADPNPIEVLNSPLFGAYEDLFQVTIRRGEQ